MPTSIYVSEGEPRRERGYGRDGNPGWEALEEALGGLEDAEAVAFASGQAASMALMLTLAQGRERIVLAADGYYGARLLADKLRPHGAEPVHADLRDLAAVERELKGNGPRRRCSGPRRRPTRCCGSRIWPHWPRLRPRRTPR